VGRQQLQVVAFGPPQAHGAGTTSTASKELGEKEKGFINEMRRVAMKLHTKDQAPKEGGVEAPKPRVWAPTLKGYLRFLTESQAVYQAMESAVQDTSMHPEYAAFQQTGLERSQALTQDLAWFKEKFDLDPPLLEEAGPGTQYAQKVLGLAKTDPQAFICHFYNYYFAHTAGGKMIGSKVAGMLLEGHTLHFYQWNGDLQEHLDGVRKQINELSEHWEAEQKQHCLAETTESFKMAGVIMGCITSEV